MDAVIKKLREAGIEIEPEGEIVRVAGNKKIRSVDMKTAPYPGFPTDMQAQFMVLMSLSRGLSVISETIFENRFIHVSELRRMGANIRIEGNSAIIQGRENLSGAPVMATDLRASASLILAGLAADGVTEVSRVYHLDRGYEGWTGSCPNSGPISNGCEKGIRQYGGQALLRSPSSIRHIFQIISPSLPYKGGAPFLFAKEGGEGFVFSVRTIMD